MVFYSRTPLVFSILGVHTPAAGLNLTVRDNLRMKSDDEVDLDGIWQLETADRAFVGVPVRVPATWQSQGIGAPTGLLRHQFIGVGTYSKPVVLRQRPPNSTCWLWIGGAPGGVLRSATVSANGQHIGRHVGYLQPVELQLPCTNTLELAVAVDS